MTAISTFVTYPICLKATTDVAYTIGTAQALLVTATCSSGLVLTLVDGNTVDVGNAVIGTIIPITSTKATFGAGTVVAMRLFRTND